MQVLEIFLYIGGYSKEGFLTSLGARSPKPAIEIWERTTFKESDVRKYLLAVLPYIYIQLKDRSVIRQARATYPQW